MPGIRTALVVAGAVITMIVGTVSATAASRPPAAARWVGTFDGFPGTSWATAWGQAAEKAWGLGGDLTAQTDASSPGGAILDARYGAHSSAHSCTNCPATGGGEFYTQFAALGHPEWATAAALDLKYFLRFPTGFDFGKGGKLPGLYGGKIGEESGGVHGNGFSTRYMWRAPRKGEVYFYSPAGSGFGKDLGLGRWTYAADGRWHSIEQLVDRAGQRITVWYDGRQVFSTKVSGIATIPFSGVFFSTFFGGHDQAWGPKKTVHAAFADFSVTTAVQH
jgi:Polysaccharide lyase 14